MGLSYEPSRLPVALPQHEGIVVRPDALWATAQLKVEGVVAERAVPLLQQGAAHVAERVHEVAGAATVRPRRFGSRDVSTKLKGAIEETAWVELVIDVPLADGEDYWARARLVEGLEHALRGAALELVKRKPPLLTSVAAAVAVVRDQERHRDALLDRWLARAGRAHELANGIALAPLVVPGEIVQTPEGLDAVRLVFGTPKPTSMF